MVAVGENLYPDAFEVVGCWEPADPTTVRDFPGSRFLVMFFVPSDSEVLREAFLRVFDALEFLMVSSRAWRQSAIAVPPEKLTCDDRLRIDEMLRARQKRILEARFWAGDQPSLEERIAPAQSYLRVPITLLVDGEPEF
jgi:hypothetical protein